MIKVGLIGEDPYDKEAIKNLLTQRYPEVNFKPLLRGIRGGGLDNPKTGRAIQNELKTNSYEFIVFIRDLDGLPSQNDLRVKVKKWFADLKHKNTDLLLLNIWELEALIFGDLDTFNKLYKVSVRCTGDPMMERDPKGTLITATAKGRKKYSESDCPELFSKLDISKVEKKCRFFREFLQEFDRTLKAQ